VKILCLFRPISYIPLGGEYLELYNLLAYFLPLDQKEDETKPKNWMARFWDSTQRKRTEGDKQLRQVAQDGLTWSENVGNKQDIEAYVYRLSLGTISPF
jgi:hypothetical protein